MDSKGGSWQQSGGLLQPPWLCRSKASPTLPCRGSQEDRGDSVLFFVTINAETCERDSPCWTRKAALSNSPGDCCNQPGFAAAKRVQLYLAGGAKRIEETWSSFLLQSMQKLARGTPPVGLERRLLATVRGTVATNLGLPQQSESNSTLQGEPRGSRKLGPLFCYNQCRNLRAGLPLLDSKGGS